MAPKWFDKNLALSDAQNLDQLRQALQIAIDLYRDAGLLDRTLAPGGDWRPGGYSYFLRGLPSPRLRPREASERRSWRFSSRWRECSSSTKS